MSFTDAIVSAFSNYANFSGRARRSEFWYFCLFKTLVRLALLLFSALVLGPLLGLRPAKLLYDILKLSFSVAAFIPHLALIWRRLHDIGKSGANYLWILVPLAGVILLVVWWCRDGDEGDNAYGADPKQITDS